jgi:hypothetical protein
MKAKLLIFLLTMFCTSVIPQTQTIVWDYPVKPGTETWKKLENNAAKVSVCQIPENLLSKISVKDLMSICLQYPLLYDVFAFNNINSGLEKLFSDFNGIRELSKKDSALNSLCEQYVFEIHHFPNILKASDLEIGHSIAKISILEVLLSYSELHNNTTKEIQKEILKNLLFGYKEKCKYHGYFQGSGFTTNLFARAHIIIKIDTTLFTLFERKNKAVLFSGMADADLIDTIDKMSYTLIKE